MKLEKEITVKVNCNYESLDKNLNNKGFKLVQEYSIDDIYMISEYCEIEKMKELDILSKCVLIRDIVGFTKQIVRKYKKYAENGDILEQSKVKCEIYNINEALNLLISLGFKELFKIHDEIKVYVNDDIEFAVQLVNGKHIFIEIEDECQFLPKKFETIEEMIYELEKYDIDYDKSDYFVKKALITLREVLKK